MYTNQHPKHIAALFIFISVIGISYAYATEIDQSSVSSESFAQVDVRQININLCYTREKSHNSEP